MPRRAGALDCWCSRRFVPGVLSKGCAECVTSPLAADNHRNQAGALTCEEIGLTVAIGKNLSLTLG